MTSDHTPDEERDDHDPARDLEEMLRGLLSGGSVGGVSMNPEDLAKIAGLPFDTASLSGLFAGLREAMSAGDSDGIDWSTARKTAISVATQGTPETFDANVHDAFGTASLWLDEVTAMGGTSDAPRNIGRVEWVQQTIDTWIQMAEPVALSISETLTTTMEQHLPEEMQGAMAQAHGMLRRVGGALFAMQLGQIVGTLAREVVSGGDVGIPLLSGEGREGGALLSDNLAGFADGLDQSHTEIVLFLATRELAHARLFRHAKWLRLHLVTSITEYARGIEIDVDHLEDVARDFDPMQQDQLQDLLRSGSLIPPKTPRQEAAHERLQTMLALVDGWVDVVTREATKRMPGGVALSEMIRRRRAVGGPSERAFSTLVGLELRPRLIREAAAMWDHLTEFGGSELRDSLWAHPDILPTADEIRDPQALLQRLELVDREKSAEELLFDEQLRDLLADGSGDAVGPGDAGGPGDTGGPGDADDSDESGNTP